jgi:hypothetical protein
MATQFGWSFMGPLIFFMRSSVISQVVLSMVNHAKIVGTRFRPSLCINVFIFPSSSKHFLCSIFL